MRRATAAATRADRDLGTVTLPGLRRDLLDARRRTHGNFPETAAMARA
jgi:hypothetical protein